MKKVFVKFYDQGNLGDDLFIEILLGRYKNEFVARRTNSKGGFIPSFDLTTIRDNQFVFVLDKIISRITGVNKILTINSIRACDLMVYIGGSLFMETTGVKPWLRVMRYFQRIKVPYYILGSNVGPVNTNKFLDILAIIFKNAQDVCFRDQASYKIFNHLPSTRVATDIAFTLDVQKYSQTSCKNIVISVIDGYRKFDDATAESYEKEIAKLSKRLNASGYKVILMSFCKREGDEDAIKRILNNMNDELRNKVSTYTYTGNLDEGLRILSSSEIIVASRFHATILGLLFNKKVLPMAYSDKTTNMLNDMDFKGPIIDIRKIDDFDGSTFDFKQLQVNDVSEQIDLAEKQFQELDKVLTRR